MPVPGVQINLMVERLDTELTAPVERVTVLNDSGSKDKVRLSSAKR